MKVHEDFLLNLYTIHTVEIFWKTFLFQLRICLALDLKNTFHPQIIVVEQD